MISFIEGTVEYCGDTSAILSAGGIGYSVTMVPKSINSLSKKEGKVKLFIHSRMNTREGTFVLYGFEKKEDLALFELLISVSGIGPKNAIGIMANVNPKDIKTAVVEEDASYLRKISGLGPKTAQRLVLELKNKIEYLNIEGGDSSSLGQRGDAVEALSSLGYSKSQALKALDDVGDGKTLQEQVREALRLLGKK